MCKTFVAGVLCVLGPASHIPTDDMYADISALGISVRYIPGDNSQVHT